MLRVDVHRTIAELAQRRAALDDLNRASRRPCPYATLEYLETFVAHDEHARPNDQVLFLTAHEGEQLVGYLPLRRRREVLLGLPFTEILLLTTHDTDRPHLVARVEDERRCAQAFYRYLVEQEPDWSFVELSFQDAESGLCELPDLDPSKFYTRRYPSMENTTVPLPFPTLEAYFRSLSSSFRNTVSRLSRRLLEAGNVEVWSSADPRARLALLELYLDVERRSWKETAHAGVRRDERRVAFFRELCGANRQLALQFDLVLLDGVPIAGIFGGGFGKVLHAIETTFDEAYADLSPGYLLWLMSMRSAIVGGFTAHNLDGNYAYYKSRWGGVVTETSSIQVFRKPSVPYFKARLGEVRRRLRRGEEKPPLSNPDRASSERANEKKGAGARPPRDASRALARSALEQLEAAGARVERLSGKALEAVLPFKLEHPAPQRPGNEREHSAHGKPSTPSRSTNRMPRVSIGMPTYNRADTIGRAIASVVAQSYQDWELVIVDDGSTDGTADKVRGMDPRIRVIVQENRGLGGARNTALAQSQGELIAFLDSDDEWPAHHLALATAFFDTFPKEHVYTSEFWEDFGNQDYVKHFRVETGSWYPATAKRIGSRFFDRGPPQGDPYLWFYASKTPVGDWASAALASTPYRDVQHYVGNIFDAWRWGWMMAMQSTVISREAMEKTGPQDAWDRAASDYGYLARLCRGFRVNMLTVPGCIKHEYAAGKQDIAEGHIVTGKAAVQFHANSLRYLEELFWKQAPDDPDLRALRGFRQYLLGEAALLKGDREVAISALSQAVETYPGRDVAAMLWLARLVPRPELASAVYRAANRVVGLPYRARKVLSRLRAAAHL